MSLYLQLQYTYNTMLWFQPLTADAAKLLVSFTND